MNRKCSQYQTVYQPDAHLPEDQPALLDHVAIESTQDDTIDLPKPPNTVRLVCFSDWRIQSIESIHKFFRNLTPRPDVILYAGDDVERFVEVTDPSVLPFIGRGIRIHLPRALSRKKPTLEVVCKFIHKEFTQFRTNTLALDALILPDREEVGQFIQGCSEGELETFEYRIPAKKSARTSTVHINQHDNTEAKMTIRQFYTQYPFTKELLTQFHSFPDLKTVRVRNWERSLRIELQTRSFEYSIIWKKPDLISEKRISARQNHDLQILFSWLKEYIPPPLTLESLLDYLKDTFQLAVFAPNKKYGRRRSVPPDIWLAILSMDDAKLDSFIKRNHFAELAGSAIHGLFAVIGNDCYPGYKALIRGDHVFDLGNSTTDIGNFLLLGLEGAESITKTVSERRIEKPVGHSGDMGATIYTQTEYQILLKQLHHPDNKNKIKIILSHSPPFKCLDLARRFEQIFIGSMALRQAIVDDPMVKLVVCGHVHLHGGKHEKLYEALVVNCSSHDQAGHLGNVAILDLNRESGLVEQVAWKQVGSDLELRIRGVGAHYAGILETAGYNHPVDLLNDPIELIHKQTGQQIGKKRLAKFIERADAYVNAKIIYRKDTGVVSTDDLRDGILLDIETDMTQSEIWCIGTLFQDTYRAFFLSEARNDVLAKTMLDEFIAFLQQIEQTHGRRPIYCFSGTNFDFRGITTMLTQYNCLPDFFDAWPKHDVFHELVRAVTLPISNYKLKNVAKFLKYPQELEPGYDGLAAAMDYYQSFDQSTQLTVQERKSMQHKLLAYNEDDLQQILWIWEKLFEK